MRRCRRPNMTLKPPAQIARHRRASDRRRRTLRVVDDPAEIDADAWNALLARRPRRRRSCATSTCARCTRRAAPWPRPAGRRSSSSLERGGELVGRLPALPQGPLLRRVRVRLGLGRRLPAPRPRYYPKLLGAVPFTPVPGPRLLARDAAQRAPAAARRSMQLARAGASCRRCTCCSSPTPTRPRLRRGRLDAAQHACSSTGRNRAPAPYADFADFLASLQRDKRKKIRQERRKVADAGVTLHAARAARRSATPTGTSSTAATRRTYRAHHSTPYLTRDFFARDGARRCPSTGCCSSPSATASAIASVADRARSASARVAYGRYWGALE